MEKGMGAYRAVADEEALEFLADVSNGDARSALNAIELGILTTERSADGLIHITLDVASECIQKRVIKYDKNGDSHYDNISAFIKSMRGSDPDAAVYYLAKMLYAGEDVTFIARRIMICASEDVGNADPNALHGGGQLQPRQWSGLECRRHGSCWHRQSLMWRAHQRAMRPTWQWTKHFPLSESREPHRFQRISVMPITKVLGRLGRWHRIQICPRLSESLCGTAVSAGCVQRYEIL